MYILAVQFYARLFGSLNTGYCLSISVIARWKGLAIPRDHFISCQHGPDRPGRARSGLMPPAPRQVLSHRAHNDELQIEVTGDMVAGVKKKTNKWPKAVDNDREYSENESRSGIFSNSGP
ncbi:Uncharacterized protein HZ326_24204 [Fusarium oxysporum f. sp. albedinis]|nr:Uncharacterized protein HZ326_24204 [Fusarium oxysporum f. sp. albedinis]